MNERKRMKNLLLIACGFLCISCIFTRAYGNDWYSDIVRTQQKAQIREGQNQYLWDKTVKLSNSGKKLEKIPSQIGALNVESLKLGSEGRIDCWVGRIEHVLSPTNCIISYARKRFFVLNGYCTENLVDDMNVALIDRIKVVGTQSIKLADGSSKKVFVLNFATIATDKKDMKETITTEDRLWTDNSGDFQINARFIKLIGEDVILEKDDNQVKIPLSTLSIKDQKFVRSEVQKKKQ